MQFTTKEAWRPVWCADAAAEMWGKLARVKTTPAARQRDFSQGRYKAVSMQTEVKAVPEL